LKLLLLTANAIPASCHPDAGEPSPAGTNRNGAADAE
jgi:hypothetical protein